MDSKKFLQKEDCDDGTHGYKATGYQFFEEFVSAFQGIDGMGFVYGHLFFLPRDRFQRSHAFHQSRNGCFYRLDFGDGYVFGELFFRVIRLPLYEDCDIQGSIGDGTVSDSSDVQHYLLHISQLFRNLRNLIADAANSLQPQVVSFCD
jgi:hypothetical protein